MVWRWKMGKMVRALMYVTMAKDATRGDKYTHTQIEVTTTTTTKRKTKKKRKRVKGRTSGEDWSWPSRIARLNGLQSSQFWARHGLKSTIPCVWEWISRKLEINISIKKKLILSFFFKCSRVYLTVILLWFFVLPTLSLTNIYVYIYCSSDLTCSIGGYYAVTLGTMRFIVMCINKCLLELE